MRLLLASCLLVFGSLSAQAYERSITIEADIRVNGELQSVWAAYNAKLETNGYSKCMIKYAGFNFKCSVSQNDGDPLVSMNGNNFDRFTDFAAKNYEIKESLVNQFYRNIDNYSQNYDTNSNKAPVLFRLYEKEAQPNSFISINASSTSIIRVRQH